MKVQMQLGKRNRIIIEDAAHNVGWSTGGNKPEVFSVSWYHQFSVIEANEGKPGLKLICGECPVIRDEETNEPVLMIAEDSEEGGEND